MDWREERALIHPSSISSDVFLLLLLSWTFHFNYYILPEDGWWGFFVLEATSIFYIKCMMHSGSCSQELSASTPPVKVTELNFLVPVCSSFSQKILSVRLVLNIPLTMTHQHGREFDRQKDSRLFFCLRWTISIVFKSSQLLPTFLVMPNKTQCRSLLLF